jgi:hypothetical protein
LQRPAQLVGRRAGHLVGAAQQERAFAHWLRRVLGIGQLAADGAVKRARGAFDERLGPFDLCFAVVAEHRLEPRGVDHWIVPDQSGLGVFARAERL